MLNKPPGYLCTRNDPDHRPVIYELIDEKYRDMGLFSVGRLDYLSEGLLLLTNDGDLAHKVSHPSGGVLKSYEVHTKQPVPYKVIAAWKNGIYIKEDFYRIKDFNRITSHSLLLTLAEGKNREIRRLFESIDIEVIQLKRIAIGPLRLGSLESGKTRELTSKEQHNILHTVRQGT
jgi:23S rRNA pseudouridine2605 synthase